MSKLRIEFKVQKKNVEGKDTSTCNCEFDEEYAKGNVIPKPFQEYLTDLNHYLANNIVDYVRGRDNEVNRIYETLLKTQNNNAMILGDRGVGKSAVLQATVYGVLKNICPQQLNTHHFLFLDLDKLIINTTNSDKKISKTLKKLFDFLLHPENVVVVIDDIHKVVLSPILMYYLQQLLNDSTTKVIGITTEEEFEGYFSYEPKLASLFDIIKIQEPKIQKMYSMISEYVHLMEKAHGVTISEEIVNYTVSVSAAFSSQLRNPGLAINIIEKSMIVAKKKGHKEVQREDVNSNFNFNYELYNMMPDEEKRNTAYHEAGHYIVAEKSENIKNFRTTAITIVPAEDFLGITLFEFELEKQPTCNYDYYVDNIAADLAGRIAETIMLGTDSASKLTNGAYTDLKNATITARSIVTEYGMVESCGQNMTYFCNYDSSDLALLSEERKKQIDTETEKIIKEAYKRGQKILTENRELLDVIATALLENEVLDEKDLQRLCAQVEANK